MDAREAGQLQAPGFTRDTATQKPRRGGSGRAPQRGHADKSKSSLERDPRSHAKGIRLTLPLWKTELGPADGGDRRQILDATERSRYQAAPAHKLGILGSHPCQHQAESQKMRLGDGFL